MANISRPSLVRRVRGRWALLLLTACSGEANINAAPRDLIPADSLVVFEFDFASLREQWDQLAMGRGIQPIQNAAALLLSTLKTKAHRMWPLPLVDWKDGLTQARFTLSLSLLEGPGNLPSICLAVEPNGGSWEVSDYRQFFGSIPGAAISEVGAGMFAVWAFGSEIPPNIDAGRAAINLDLVLKRHKKGTPGSFWGSLASYQESSDIIKESDWMFYFPGECYRDLDFAPFAMEMMRRIAGPDGSLTTEILDPVLAAAHLGVGLNRTEGIVLGFSLEPPGLRESYFWLGKDVGMPFLNDPGANLDDLVIEMAARSGDYHFLSSQSRDFRALGQAWAPHLQDWLGPFGVFAPPTLAGLDELEPHFLFLETLENTRNWEIGDVDLKVRDKAALRRALEQMPPQVTAFLTRMLGWNSIDSLGLWLAGGEGPDSRLAQEGEATVGDSVDFQNAVAWAREAVGDHQLIDFTFRSSATFASMWPDAMKRASITIPGLGDLSAPRDTQADWAAVADLWGWQSTVIFACEKGICVESISPLGMRSSGKFIEQTAESINADGDDSDPADF